jgi:hypothetical protein
MTIASMPGFTAERSLYPSNTSYRMVGTYAGLSEVGEVVPQKMTRVCSECSDTWRGTRYCCDIEITCNPYGGCTVAQWCETEECGILPDWERWLG